MSKKKEHNDLHSIDKQSKAFFTDGKFDWEKSSAAVWDEMELAMEGNTKSRSLKLNFATFARAMAAVFVLLLGVAGFMRFYTKTVTTLATEHFVAELPDGSKVNLNAESSISYKPYWWNFKRDVQFEGEALFEVEKGKKFRVISSKGVTEVLGTSFNIFSREAIYNVTCITGSVKVVSSKNRMVVLKPNSKAVVKPNGNIEVEKNIETFPEISWKQNIFLFTASPIREVFYEIERQYGVSIKTAFKNYGLYSGNFNRDQSVEEILGYVCPALGLEFKQTAKGEFVVTEEHGMR